MVSLALHVLASESHDHLALWATSAVETVPWTDGESDVSAAPCKGSVSKVQAPERGELEVLLRVWCCAVITLAALLRNRHTEYD